MGVEVRYTVEAMLLRRLAALGAMGLFLSGGVLPACSSTANVSEVWTSLDGDGARRRTTFFTDTATIACVAQYGNGRQDVTLELLIRQVDGDRAVLALEEFRPAITSGVPGKASLKLTPARVVEGVVVPDANGPFQAGNYVCEARLDGQLQPKGSAAFTIQAQAACPTVRILSGQRCEGFYETGKTCPQGGRGANNDPSCECKESGWECEK